MKHSHTDSSGKVVGMLGFGLILDRVEEAKGEEKAKGDEPAVILREVRCGVPAPKGEGGARLDAVEGGRCVYPLGLLLVLLLLLIKLFGSGVDVLDWSDMDETDPRDEVELLLSWVGDGGGKYSCFCGIPPPPPPPPLLNLCGWTCNWYCS